MKQKLKAFFAIFIACLYAVCLYLSYNDHDNTLERYTKEGFRDLGEKYDTIIEIHDYHIDEEDGCSYITVYNLEYQGLYFESPYAAYLSFNSSVWMREEDFCTLSSWNITNYEAVNDKTITIGKDEEAYDLVLQEVLEVNEIGRIFKAKEDYFGVNDREDILYFAVKYDDLIKLETNEFGDESWEYGFSGVKERRIYF